MANSDDSYFAALKPEEFICGETPDDIDQQCLDLCQSFLGGSWNNATIDDIVVSRIYGGIANQMYRVQLKDSVEESPEDEDNSRDVAIKLYQEKRLKSNYEGDPERLNDNIVLTHLSQAGIVPRVFGIFQNGFIQAFHESQKFTLAHQQNKALLRELVHSLAKFHHLKVPIRKTRDWQLTQAQNMLTEMYAQHPVQKYIEEFGLEYLSKFELRQEFEKFKTIISNLKYPLYFVHNDFLGTNVLVTEAEKKVMLIDVEQSCYGSRGYDIGLYCASWGLEPQDYDNFDMPPDSVIENFINIYLEGCELISPGYSTKPENSVATILRESKLYTCVFFLFWTIFFLHQSKTIIKAIPYDRKKNYQLAERYYKKYCSYIVRLTNDGTIQN